MVWHDWSITGWGLMLLVSLQGACDYRAPARKRDASDDFFDGKQVPQLKIDLAEINAQKLRDLPREYVKGKLTENGNVLYGEVAVKLKGAAGSFRHFNDRPALSLNVGKHKKKQEFHGLDKFHLNNSVQDESLLNEMLISDICKQAGVPTPRTTHARVRINERDLGMFVLKEGFDKRFIGRHFANDDGNLYEGGFVQDIDGNMQLDGGHGVDDFSDVKELIAACREGDQEKRWKAVEEKLDVDAFMSFTAMEMMSCHWDGYTGNRNNYRIYFDPDTKKAYFLLHGMDQLFGDAGFNLFPGSGSIVSSAVLSNPKWRRGLRKKIEQFLPLFSPEKLNPTIDATVERLKPALTEINQDLPRQYAERAKNTKDRIAARYQNMVEQLRREREAEPAEFDAKGNLRLVDWQAKKETDSTRIEQIVVAGQPQWTIAAGAGDRCVASWRQQVKVEKGKYRFTVRARAEKIVPLEDDGRSGAGLRLSGIQRTTQLVGDSGWTTLSYEIDVPDNQRDLQLVAELRAKSGQVWFAAPFLLQRIGD